MPLSKTGVNLYSVQRAKASHDRTRKPCTETQDVTFLLLSSVASLVSVFAQGLQNASWPGCGSALLFLWDGSLLGRSGQLTGTTSRQHGGVFVLCCCWTKIKQNRPFTTSAHQSTPTITQAIHGDMELWKLTIKDGAFLFWDRLLS